MFQDLTQRVPALEEMDKEDIAPEALQGALRSLMRINTIGNGVGIFWPALRKLLQQRDGGAAPLRVLDIGCGGGDLAWKLETRARKEGYALQIDGCDFSPVAIEMAHEYHVKKGGGRFFVLDALKDPIPDGYDVMLSSLFFHHLDNQEGRLVLEKMRDAAGTAVLLSDLIRSRFGLALVYVATRAFSRSPVVHADGVTSLLAAYTLEEIRVLAEKLDMADIALERRWPERFLLTWLRPTPRAGGTS